MILKDNFVYSNRIIIVLKTNVFIKLTFFNENKKEKKKDDKHKKIKENENSQLLEENLLL